MQVVLRLERTVADYIIAHSTVHNGLVAPAVLDLRHKDQSDDLEELQKIVASHERTIQRIIGGMVLITSIGFGTLTLMVLRITGIIP